jgi:hypothetical protein
LDRVLARVPPLDGVRTSGLRRRDGEEDLDARRWRSEQRQHLALGRGREQRRESRVCHGEVHARNRYRHVVVLTGSTIEGDTCARQKRFATTRRGSGER